MNDSQLTRKPRSSERLDQALVSRGMIGSRTQAQAAILAGQVRVNGQPASKAGTAVRLEDRLEMEAPQKYVSRGGLKLEHALVHFGLDITGKRALDLGASTGGFTDCLLQAGAQSVCAVDVGQGQLAWKLRQDPRVDVREKTNARYLTPECFGPRFIPFDLVVADCSFISLKRVLPVVPALLCPYGEGVALIKPQFEAGKAEVDRGEGVITDPEIHTRVLEDLRSFVETELPGLVWKAVCPSPLLGPAGNREFLLHFKRASS